MSLYVRDVEDAYDIDSVEATARDLTHHAEIVCRFAGDDADRATDGVASEQRTLRALQDLDAFHVEKIDIRPGGRSEEHTSELQSLMRISYAVFCLKKKTSTHQSIVHTIHLTI